jgi:hypothetical protein
MLVKRISSADLAVEKLPDGSSAIFDPGSKTVYSLNATAAAAWEASGGSTTLAQIVEKMQRSFNPAVTEDIALEALLQLREKGMVEIVAPPPGPTRRSVFATAGGVVAPMVLALTSTEQRAFAVSAGSGTTTTTTPAPTTPTTTTTLPPVFG